MTPSPTIAPAGDLQLEEDAGLTFLEPVTRLRHVVAPFPRAGLFYVRSWSNWWQHRGDDGVPAVFPSLVLTGHAFVDEAIIAGFRVVKPTSPASALVRAEAEAQAALELHDD